ncbi:MAG: PLP-dependent aminotransferase family protein [Clostridia bacterium]|nr:PLP-dependent aminotransferase family protein [Clostridia bacterium]
MKVFDKTKLSPPYYLRLYEELRDEIIAGDYPCGRKLPGKRQIAEELGLSLVTVEHALSLLTEEGYVSPRERSGYFVTFTENAGFRTPGAPLPTVPFSQSAAPDSDALDFSVLAKNMRRVIADAGDALLAKSPNAGCPQLQSALAAYLGRSRGLAVQPERIVIGAGAEYLYSLLVQIFGREKTYAMETPAYEKIEQVYAANDVRRVLLPLGSDGVESEALWACRADVLHITPYRSFPSGVSATAAKRREYIRWANAGDRFIIEDDFESEFTPSTKAEETVYSLSDKENAVYLNTFSKTVAPSLRIGYMLLPPRLQALYEERAGFYSCTAPVFDQLLIARLLQNGDFERHINRVRRKKRREIEKMP